MTRQPSTLSATMCRPRPSYPHMLGDLSQRTRQGGTPAAPQPTDRRPARDPVFVPARPDNDDNGEEDAVAHARRPGRPDRRRRTCAAPASSCSPGPPGCGRSTLLRQITAAAARPRAHRRRPGHADRACPPWPCPGRSGPGCPPTTSHLLAEAVRSRVRGGLLVLDDLQYADPATLAALPLIGRPLPGAGRAAHPAPARPAVEPPCATAPPPGSPCRRSTRAAATDLARRTAAAPRRRHPRRGRRPGRRQPPGGHRAGPARRRRPRRPPAPTSTRWRTRSPPPWPTCPAPPAPPWPPSACSAGPPRPPCSAPGAADLHAAGLVTDDRRRHAAAGLHATWPRPPPGCSTPAARADLHRRLAELTPPAEAARHLAAAGDHRGAYRQRPAPPPTRPPAATGPALLLFACDLPGVTSTPGSGSPPPTPPWPPAAPPPPPAS